MCFLEKAEQKKSWSTARKAFLNSDVVDDVLQSCIAFYFYVIEIRQRPQFSSGGSRSSDATDETSTVEQSHGARQADRK